MMGVLVLLFCVRLFFRTLRVLVCGFFGVDIAIDSTLFLGMRVQ
jgi:hypothetical protein